MEIFIIRGASFPLLFAYKISVFIPFALKKLFSLQLVVIPRLVMEEKKDQYVPGECNIGLHEVNIRKKFIWLFAPLTIVFSIACLYHCHSVLLWIMLVVSSFSLIVLYLEIKYKFCILFGFFSLYNFGRLGNLHEVKNQESICKDRSRVLGIILIAGVASLSFAMGIHYLAQCLYPL